MAAADFTVVVRRTFIEVGLVSPPEAQGRQRAATESQLVDSPASCAGVAFTPGRGAADAARERPMWEEPGPAECWPDDEDEVRPLASWQTTSTATPPGTPFRVVGQPIAPGSTPPGLPLVRLPSLPLEDPAPGHMAMLDMGGSLTSGCLPHRDAMWPVGPAGGRADGWAPRTQWSRSSSPLMPPGEAQRACARAPASGMLGDFSPPASSLGQAVGPRAECGAAPAVSAAFSPVEWRTTLMFQSLPRELTRNALEAALDSLGFAGLYDFVFVSVDFATGQGRGSAFVNMVRPECAMAAMRALDGFSNWLACDNGSACEVRWAPPNLQGFENWVRKYRNSVAVNGDVPDGWRPALYGQGGVRVQFPPPTRRVRAPRMRS